MTICFAGAAAHAPGITAWSEAAPEAQRAALDDGFARLRDTLTESRLDVLILLTSEHWANFFLDHVSAFCVGRNETYEGPIEPWLKVPRTKLPGATDLSEEIIAALHDADFDPAFSHALAFDHGTMVPLHKLMPDTPVPVVPIMFNTLAAPQPSARRCLALGRVIGSLARRSPRRIGILATGGLSHDPGEVNHGVIDSDFDQKFLQRMVAGDAEGLGRYTKADLMAAGAGAMELLAWVALAGAVEGLRGRVLAYEAVKPWATGCGLVAFECGDTAPARAAA